MIQVQKERDRVFITNTSQLDREDVIQLVKDLQQWLDETDTNGFNNKEHKEAYLQAQKKRMLEEEMKQYIASIKTTQHIDKELKTIELDPLNREVEITTTKLKENGRK